MSTIQEQTGLPERTVARVVEDVVVLGLAKREKDSGKWLVQQSEITRLYWKDEGLPETSEGGKGKRLPKVSEGAQAQLGGNGRLPRLGDSEFSAFADLCFHEGRMTKSEWLGRRKLHALIRAAAEERA